jgi:hypothetical protein
MYEWIWFPGYPEDLEECSPAKTQTRETPLRVTSAAKPSSSSKKTEGSVAFTRVLEGITKSREKTTGGGRGSGGDSGGDSGGENLTFSSAISALDDVDDEVLKPDPMIELRQVMDVSDRRRLVTWGIDDTEVVFASQNRIVAMDVNSRTFIQWNRPLIHNRILDIDDVTNDDALAIGRNRISKVFFRSHCKHYEFCIGQAHERSCFFAGREKPSGKKRCPLPPAHHHHHHSGFDVHADLPHTSSSLCPSMCGNH